MPKLPPLTSGQGGCLTCPPRPIDLPMDSNPHPGFGDLILTRDGEPVRWHLADYYCEHEIEHVTAQDFEDIAAGDTDHDWRLKVYGPLSEYVYQRHGEGLWVLVEKGMGFA